MKGLFSMFTFLQAHGSMLLMADGRPTRLAVSVGQAPEADKGDAAECGEDGDAPRSHSNAAGVINLAGRSCPWVIREEFLVFGRERSDCSRGCAGFYSHHCRGLCLSRLSRAVESDRNGDCEGGEEAEGSFHGSEFLYSCRFVGCFPLQ